VSESLYIYSLSLDGSVKCVGVKVPSCEGELNAVKRYAKDYPAHSLTEDIVAIMRKRGGPSEGAL